MLTRHLPRSGWLAAVLVVAAQAANASPATTRVPAALLQQLERCSIPSVATVSAVLSRGPYASYVDFSHLTTKFSPAPKPPYNKAPNYSIPKYSCNFLASGKAGYFALSWFTNATWLKKFSQHLPGERVTQLPLPPHALQAYRDPFGIDVLYPGLWVQWTNLRSAKLNSSIEKVVSGHY